MRIITYLVVFSLPVDAEPEVYLKKPTPPQPKPEFKTEREYIHKDIKPQENDVPKPIEFKRPTDDDILEEDTQEFEKVKGDDIKFRANRRDLPGILVPPVSQHQPPRLGTQETCKVFLGEQ